MQQIKNNRKNYITRAKLFDAKQLVRNPRSRNIYSREREVAYLEAPIDRAGYIDFRRSVPKNFSRPRRRRF
jgi:hypothetical protein